MNRSMNACLLFIAASLSTSSVAVAQCVDFDPPPPGAPWSCCGVNFMYDGVGFQTEPFFWSGGGMAAGGETHPTTACSGPTGDGSLWINNVNVQVRIMDFDPSGVRELVFRYADFGGNINLTVNGVLENRENFTDIGPFAFVGVGVDYFLTGAPAGGAIVGEVRLKARLDGCIHDVRIGGQELCIDDLCAGPPCRCPGDITGPDGAPDGIVDALDFLMLVAQWGSPCAGPCTADITGPGGVPDGNVDALDYLMLIAQWGDPANC